MPKNNSTINYNFWKCHCNYDCIQPVEKFYCNECGEWQEDCPKATQQEVDYYESE